MDWISRVPPAFPAGEPIVPDDGFADHHDGSPVMWMSTDPVDDARDLWWRLFRDRRATGLYPILLAPEGPGMEDRPWRDGELDPVPLTDVTAIDVDALMRERWRDRFGEEESRAGAGRGPDSWARPDAGWPGLARPAWSVADPDAVAGDWVDFAPSPGPRRLGLVPAATGAGAIATLGWLGPINHMDVAQTAAIVGSWEERLGFRLIELGFDTLLGTVAIGPDADPRAVAVERFLACPDDLDQSAVEDRRSYPDEVASRPMWGLWWD